jgi:hypothetical protein
LQATVLGEKKLRGNSVEGQNFVDEGVVQPAGSIDVDLQMRLFAAAKLHDAVHAHVRRAMKPIRRPGRRIAVRPT